MFQTLGEQLQAVRMACLPGMYRQVDPRLSEINRRSLGASEAVPSDGGFLIQQDFVPRLIERLYQTGEILGRCFELPISTNSNSLAFPQIDEASRANGSRMGGVSAYWGNEGNAVTTSKPRFLRSELVAKKLIATMFLTDELFGDTNAMEIFVSSAFAKENAFKLENAVVSGTGSGQPLGIMNGGAMIQVAKISGQAAGTIVSQNVVDMFARLWAPSRKTAVWLVNAEAEKQLMQLSLAVGTAGSEIPLYVATEDPDNQPYNLMLGRPVIAVEHCPVAGTPGDLILADFSRYVIGMKEAMQAVVSIHVNFNTDENCARFTMRVDGQPIDARPITPLNGTVTQSPFLSIAAR